MSARVDLKALRERMDWRSPSGGMTIGPETRTEIALALDALRIAVEALRRCVTVAERWQEDRDAAEYNLVDERAADAAVIESAEAMSREVCKSSAALAAIEKEVTL